MEGALGKPATPVELRVQGEQLRKAPGIILRTHMHARTHRHMHIQEKRPCRWCSVTLRMVPFISYPSWLRLPQPLPLGVSALNNTGRP